MGKLKPRQIHEYHVFLASPGDVNAERQAVRDVFEELNRTVAKSQWDAEFTVIDWENYSTAGIGRPQDLITKQTLEKHRQSLALIIGIMGQRFGSHSGRFESGTEEEFEWALSSFRASGFPEIKWFFRRVKSFIAPSEPEEARKALRQWEKVLAFRKKLQEPGPRQCYYKEFDDTADFRDALRNDLTIWLCDPGRPWRANDAAPDPGAVQTAMQSPPVENALHQLPPPPDDFVGRTGEIDELLSEIDKRGVHISGAFGMGGVGKTALAVVIADRLKDRYPDAQFHLDLRGVSDNPATPEEALAHVIRGFHPEAKLPESVAELQPIYRSLLDGKRAILLMDNARDAAQVEPLIPPKGCVLLVTSRNHFHLPGLYSKDLDRLPLEDAKDLLLTICQRIGGSAERIAELCGRLPLALRVAASTLNEYATLKPDDLIGRLSDEAKKGKTLEKVYEAAFQASDQLLSDDLRKKWYELSVFPADFDADTAAAVWEVENLDAVKDAVGEFVRLSLLEFIPAALRFRLHDLARSYAAGRMAPPERYAVRLRHARYFRGLLAFADGLYMRGGASVASALSLFDRESTNIQAGFVWASANAERDPNAARLCNEYPVAGVYVLSLRLHARERIGWLENALWAARALKDRAAEGVHLGNLGIAYAKLGDARKAIEFYEERVVIAREIGDRRGEGNVLGNLGNAYGDLGDARKAVEYHERALKVSREIGDRRGEGQDLGNLGNAYEILGDTRKAKEYFEQVLVIMREIGDRLGEGITLGNLGNAYASLGDARRAIEYYEQQLLITRKIGDRAGEGRGCWNLGVMYRNQRDLARAVELMQVQVDYAREIGHADAEKDASFVEALRAEMRKK